MSNIIPPAVKQAVIQKGAKTDQLAAHTIEPTKNSRITSDFGTKQTNTDDWLRINSKDQLGPSLLEDPFGREKVRLRVTMIEISHYGRLKNKKIN